MAKKIEDVKYQDFNALYEKLNDAVLKSETLRSDPLLRQQLRDFKRMSEMNDQLWEDIKKYGYSYVDPKTERILLNPAIGTFNKNVSTLLKTAQWIEDKTAAISLNDNKKSW